MSSPDKSYTILVVDDDPAIRTLMRYALPDPDLAIVECASGGEALASCERHAPAIVLLDVSMPGMDGFECCRRLRQLPQGGDCAIIMVTALDKPEDIERAFEAGATDYMTKPLSWRLFKRRVRNVLEAGDTLRELKQNKSMLDKAETYLTWFAFNDLLTNLPNRRAFMEQCHEALGAAREEAARLALVIIDLDRFKHVNDSYGPSTGDKLLLEAATRLRRCLADITASGALPPQGAPGLARLGGDEFIVLLSGEEAVGSLPSIAQALLDQCAEPFVLDGKRVYLSASIGIALYPQDGPDMESLLQHADIALHHAKQTGRNNCQIYSHKLDYPEIRLLNLEADMHRALEEREFELWYQPQIQNGRLKGFEALLRWRHPERGLLMPSNFIHIAENSGLIIPLGKWVLEEACRHARTWQEDMQSLSVAVNLSAHQFNPSFLPGQIRDSLESSGLPPHLLELEITESAIIRDVDEAIALLEELKDMGVQLAIDDFGTGYSSFSYLKRFPIDTLKIDKAFVDEIVSSRKDAAIVQTILQLADNLGLSALAEGVETLDQLQALTALGCGRFQGYLFSKPIPAGSLARFFEEFTQLMVIDG